MCVDEVATFSPNSYGAKAAEDMANAAAVIPTRIGTPRGGIFWCEQAIEKYFKHIISRDGDAQGLTLRYKLLPLAKQAGYRCSDSERYLLAELARMYYERYPADEGEDVPEDLTWDDVDKAYALALKIQKWTYTVDGRSSRKIRRGLKELQF